MSSKKPVLKPNRPPVLSLTFWVDDCPAVYGSDDVETKERPLYPWRVVVETRPRGTRIQVACKPKHSDFNRTVNFNVDGYSYQPAPAWLIILWAKAQAEVDDE